MCVLRTVRVIRSEMSLWFLRDLRIFGTNFSDKHATNQKYSIKQLQFTSIFFSALGENIIKIFVTLRGEMEMAKWK